MGEMCEIIHMQLIFFSSPNFSVLEQKKFLHECKCTLGVFSSIFFLYHIEKKIQFFKATTIFQKYNIVISNSYMFCFFFFFRLGMALWQQNLELEEAKVHLDKSALILEMVRRETSSNLPKIVDGRMATNYKLTLFDIQTQCYQALQRILVTLGKENEALVIAERARIRAFVDLLQTTKDNNR